MEDRKNSLGICQVSVALYEARVNSRVILILRNLLKFSLLQLKPEDSDVSIKSFMRALKRGFQAKYFCHPIVQAAGKRFPYSGPYYFAGAKDQQPGVE